MKKSFYWICVFIQYVVLIIISGSIIGMIAFAFASIFLQTEYSFLFLIKKGGSVGARYAGVWAIGLSIVFCFIKAHAINKK